MPPIVRVTPIEAATRPVFSGGTAFRAMIIVMEYNPLPPIPCNARHTILHQLEVVDNMTTSDEATHNPIILRLTAHPNEVTMNTTKDAISITCRPNMSLSLERMMANAGVL